MNGPGPNAARVLGALYQEGGSLVPSDLRARYDFSEPAVPTDAPHEFRADISSVQNIEQGIRELESMGLAEWTREGVVKTLALTDIGREFVAENT